VWAVTAIIPAPRRQKQGDLEFEAGIHSETLSQERKKKDSRVLMAHTCNPTQEAEIRKIEVPSQPREVVCKTLARKTHHKKRGWWSGSKCRP
jgi:hypothetical protein